MPPDHLFAFICVNQKANDKKCCAQFGSESIFEYFREQVKLKRHLMKPSILIKAVKTSCLGQCAFGPNIFISPDNLWYTFHNQADIDEIIQSHFIEGKIVTRLINTDIKIEMA